MQANWGLILNVLLLVGVVVAIGRLMKARRRSLVSESYEPSLGSINPKPCDDIIAVRKINFDLPAEEPQLIKESIAQKPALFAKEPETTAHRPQENKSSSLMMFLLAKENRNLAGYELLQTILAAGLRYGESNLFHRHQHLNGQGPILCSLAAATASGVFDLQNIGAFSARGLCLFMQASGNPTIDAERFHIMYETAKQLSEGLDTHLLDEKKKPLTEASLAHYRKLLNIQDYEAVSA